MRIKRNNELTKSLVEDFNSRRQLVKRMTEKEAINSQRQIKKGYNKPTKAPIKKSYYDSYKLKYDSGDFDSFGTRDLMYFFSDTAKEEGIKYVEANSVVSMRQFKLCIQRGYSPRDIATMIAFLFTSEQDYLDKRALTPNILVSTWCNTIYKDSQDWVNDKYVPKSKSKHKNREWVGSKDVENTSIGEWGV